MKKPVWLKPLLFVVLLAPMTVLAISWVRLLSGTDVPALTADPVAETTRVLGEWSLRSLLAALAVTPVARLTGWTPILTARRMVGLIAFSSVLVHWSFWMWLDQIGRGSCRERVCQYVWISVVAGTIKNNR